MIHDANKLIGSTKYPAFFNHEPPGEDIMATEIYKEFEAKLKECLGKTMNSWSKHGKIQETLFLMARNPFLVTIWSRIFKIFEGKHITFYSQPSLPRADIYRGHNLQSASRI